MKKRKRSHDSFVVPKARASRRSREERVPRITSSSRRHRPQTNAEDLGYRNEMFRESEPRMDISKLVEKMFECITSGDTASFRLACSQATRELRNKDHSSSYRASNSRSLVKNNGKDSADVHPRLHFVRGGEGLTLMEAACKYGRLSIGKFLFKAGISTRRVTESKTIGELSQESIKKPREYAGWTPLHYACANERFMVASWLVSQAGAYGDSDREAEDGVTTPRALGLERLLRMARRARESEKKLKESRVRQKKREELRLAQETVAETKRKQRMTDFARRLQIELDNEAKSRGERGERWLDSFWEIHNAEIDKQYAMSSRDWDEYIRAQTLISKRKRQLVLYNGNKRGRRGESQSKATIPGENEKFLDVEARWRRFEDRLKLEEKWVIKSGEVPFPTAPPSNVQPHRFGYFRDLTTMLSTSSGAKRVGNQPPKKVLRTLYLRFHPDKVRARFAKYVASGSEGEKELVAIMTMAKEVTQALTAVKNRLA
mmetsp:Transcript_14335/g.21780  ORF Transcript_14335/g.21780 Transcript_14335/m.21780 type:complete len:489 (+) Transcript_14335:146-1612(+)